MNGLSRPSAAPVPIEFNGKTYLLEPLTMRDLGTVEQHLLKRKPNLIELAEEAAERRIERARNAAADLLRVDPEAKGQAAELISKAHDAAEETIKTAWQEAKKVNRVTPVEVQQWIDSREGMAFTLWLSFEKRYRGEYSLAQMNDIFDKLSEDRLKELMKERDQAAGLDAMGNSTGQTQSPSDLAAAKEAATGKS